MENQSANKIVCRKCGGAHFTIKCGKEKIEEKKDIIVTEKKERNHDFEKKERNHDFEKKDRNHDFEKKERNHDFEKRDRKQYFKTTYRVKISDLPIDMSEEEMMELTSEWGHIVRVKVLNYKESSVAYVDFGYEAEANYFVTAIDKTPFELILISAIRVESFRTENYNPT